MYTIPDTTAAAVREVLSRPKPPLSSGATSHREAISVNNNCMKNNVSLKTKHLKQSRINVLEDLLEVPCEWSTKHVIIALQCTCTKPLTPYIKVVITICFLQSR